MKEIKLSLSLDDINKILNVLGDQPYTTVFKVINSIQTQAQAQLQENQNGQPNQEELQSEPVPIEKSKP